MGSAFTKFEEFALSGTFGTSYVFPQLILSGSQLAPEKHYKVGGFQDDKFLCTDGLDWHNENLQNNGPLLKYCGSHYTSNTLKTCGSYDMEDKCGSRLSISSAGEFGIHFST